MLLSRMSHSSTPSRQKIAFIAHPTEIELFRSYIKYLKPTKTYNDLLLLKLFEWAPSYIVKQWHDLSLDGHCSCDALFIMVPFLPEMRDIKINAIYEKIMQALVIAEQYNCTIASLGAFISIVLQGKETEIQKQYNIRLTSGNTFTSAVIAESINSICQFFDTRLDQQRVAVIGASGDIGSSCISYFSKRVKSLVLAGRNKSAIEAVLEKNQLNCHCAYEITTNNKSAVSDADVVICVTSAYTPILSLSDFKPKTIICDASAPQNVNWNSGLRDDVFLYHGGIVRVPFDLTVGFQLGVPSPNTFYACQIEGLLLALNPEVACSIGKGNISQERIEQFLSFFRQYPQLQPVYSIGSIEYKDSQMNAYRDYWFSR